MPPLGRRTQPAAPPLAFSKRLVLNQWLLTLLECKGLDTLYGSLRDVPEGVDENNVSWFYHRLTSLLFSRKELDHDQLLAYDQNIFSHTLTIAGKREPRITWKYFQYLGLLFAEIYLDRFFTNPTALLESLNEHVARFNEGKPARDQVSPYAMGELRKLAFWNATGSGKTLLMHVNILQYRHYLEKHGRGKELNRILLLTPNEGLSRQHLEELIASGMKAMLFSKTAGRLFSAGAVEIIDIHKLEDKMGEKTVAVDAFEGNNLVLVDEGHRGASGYEWKARRDKLCEQGFSFEYSATFGQAMKAANKQGLVQEYAKCILFDYSYKYFHGDGFGKHYAILNLADDSNEPIRKLYLTACLLVFYQQQQLYSDRKAEFAPYLLEKPLWVFVGGSVNAVRTENKRKVSDVLDILLFLQDFVKNRGESIAALKRLMEGTAGLLDDQGRNIFAKTFAFLHKGGKTAPEELYHSILVTLFNCPVDGAELHIENLKGVGGELAIRLGDNDYCGLINVGDDSALLKLCEEHGLSTTEKPFAQSLFQRLNDKDSTVNILIGSKKFMEGWSCWRVSTMGLMNVGKSEGSEIIQLFGRGVRLKGKDFSLKRSSIAGYERTAPEFIRILETLNIFGVRANYMQEFKRYLEEEGLPAGTEDFEEFFLPVLNNLKGKNLKTIRVKSGMSYKRQAPRPLVSGPIEGVHVMLDWYPKIQALKSGDKKGTGDNIVKRPHPLQPANIAFMDLDALYSEVQKFKNESSWHNLILPREAIALLLADPRWYSLLIPEEELNFTGSGDFRRIRHWQEIAASLLKKYCEAFYADRRSRWETSHSEFVDLTEDDFKLARDEDGMPGYKFTLDKDEHQDVLETLKQLKDAVLAGRLKELEARQGSFFSFNFARHLYGPLIHIAGGSSIQVVPVNLNDGEKDFVLDLKAFFEASPEFFDGLELYLLRNQSKGRGLGLQTEASVFYPDFIMWLTKGEKQFITFVDPKGIRNLNGIADHKVQFARTIKFLEAQLADPNTVLNSYLLSTTSFAGGGWWNGSLTMADFANNNVLFQKDDRGYIEKMLRGVLASGVSGG